MLWVLIAVFSVGAFFGWLAFSPVIRECELSSNGLDDVETMIRAVLSEMLPWTDEEQGKIKTMYRDCTRQALQEYDASKPKPDRPEPQVMPPAFPFVQSVGSTSFSCDPRFVSEALRQVDEAEGLKPKNDPGSISDDPYAKKINQLFDFIGWDQFPHSLYRSVSECLSSLNQRLHKLETAPSTLKAEKVDEMFQQYQDVAEYASTVAAHLSNLEKGASSELLKLEARVEKLEAFLSDDVSPMKFEDGKITREELRKTVEETDRKFAELKEVLDDETKPPETQPGSEASKIKRMNLNEFRDAGYLQEVNRLFFHPLGLALEVYQDENGQVTHLGGIWDYRDDPEGMAFGDDLLGTDETIKKWRFIKTEFDKRTDARRKLFGAVTQPIPARPVAEPAGLVDICGSKVAEENPHETAIRKFGVWLKVQRPEFSKQPGYDFDNSLMNAVGIGEKCLQGIHDGDILISFKTLEKLLRFYGVWGSRFPAHHWADYVKAFDEYAAIKTVV